jgi:membrane protease YdiL (CAAX protease family)
MHMGRIITIVGSVIAVVAMFIKKAGSEGEDVLGSLPADLNENTVTALYNDTSWAAIVFGIAAIVAFVVAVFPPIKEPMKRVLATTATAMGAIMLLVGIFATLGAKDDADALVAGFNQLAEAGQIPVAFSVSIGFGWYMLIFAGALVAVGGVVGLMNKSDTAS